MNTVTTESPADIAMSITGRPYLSWSQLNTFRGCPRAFAYKYVEAAGPAFTSSALLFGGAFHSAVQHHYEQRMQGVETDHAELLDAYRTAWAQRLDEQGDIPVRYADGEGPNTLVELADRMLKAFVESDLANPTGSIIAIEEKLEGTLDEDLPPLLAYVDLMVADENSLTLIDMKTSKSRWSDAKVSEQAEQVRLYRHLAQPLVEDHESITLAFGVVTKAKSPAVQQLDVADDGSDADTQRDALIDVVRPIWSAMQAGVDFTNPGGFGCNGCPFRGAVSGASRLTATSLKKNPRRTGTARRGLPGAVLFT
jgi:RecB family exonuclease